MGEIISIKSKLIFSWFVMGGSISIKRILIFSKEADTDMHKDTAMLLIFITQAIRNTGYSSLHTSNMNGDASLIVHK